MVSVQVVAQPNQPYRQVITARQHQFYADVPQALGGGDTAPTPHELVLAGLGGCTAMTMQMYAKRKQWDLQGVTVSVNETQQGGMPHITKNIQVKGNLSPQQVQQLEQVAEKCPVNKLLVNPKQMHTRINLTA